MKKQTKLPSLFNDVYKEKKFEKRILNKVFVPADKQFVLSLYNKTDDGLYEPKKDLALTKAESKKLKGIAKQIRKQKGRVKFVPLFVTAAFIVAVFSAVVFFKNPILKKVMQSALENAFGAKCDIASVDLRILDSRLTVGALAVANKNEPMKNLFESEKIVVDFDLVQLLKGRFVSDEITVSAIQIGTERSESGELPQKEKKVKEAVDAPPKPSIAETAKTQIASFVNEKKESGTQSVMQLFNEYNPETMINSFYNQMESPKIIASLKPQTESIVASWQTTGTELTQTVTSFTTKAQNLATADLTLIKDPASLQVLLNDINSVIKDGEAIKDSVEIAAHKVKTDTETIAKIGKQMQDAFTADMNLVNEQIASISNLNINDAARLFSGELDVPAANLIAKYLPIAETVLAKAEEFQTMGAKKAEKKPKTPAVHRSSGRTIEYRKDTVPDVLLRLVNLSLLDKTRDFSVTGTVRNVSNDCDKLNKPVEAEVVLKRNAVNTETLNAVLDLRKNRTAKAFTASFTGDGYAINGLTIPNMQNVRGIPSVSGALSFLGNIALDTDTSFDFAGALTLAKAAVTVEPFEPQFAYTLYKRALDAISQINLGANAGFSPTTRLDLSIFSDVDDIIAQSLKASFAEEIASVRAQLEAAAKAELEKLVGPLEEKLALFEDLKKIANGDTAAYDAMKAKVDAKRAEIQAKLEKAAKDAAQSAIQEATKEMGLPENIQLPPDSLDKLKDLKKFF